jgi:hypothetical protein
LRLAFKLGGDPLLHPVEAVIEWRTNSQVCHAELLFANGETFSTELSVGARYTNGSQLLPGQWECVELGPLDEDAIRERCDLLRGRSYDALGLVAYLLDCKDPDARERSFCAMLCVQILQQAANVFRFAQPSVISPGELYLMAKAREEALLQRPA